MHLDNDIIAFKSLEYFYWISSVPAFVVKPREGINTGVMLLKETHKSAHEKILYYQSINVKTKEGNGSDQDLVNKYHKQFNFTELPAKFNVYSYDMNKNHSKWWEEIILWHKPGEKWGKSYSKEAHEYIQKILSKRQQPKMNFQNTKHIF